ncbi:MAG: MerR family transcriptional regulator [Gaiellaceae bacterium]
MEGFTIGEAAERTGWSARMLRYIERGGLVVPARTEGGYRVYGLRELNQLRSLSELKQRFGVEIGDVTFVARLRTEPELRGAVETWLAGQPAAPGAPAPAWVEWEQRKQERLLAA